MDSVLKYIAEDVDESNSEEDSTYDTEEEQSVTAIDDVSTYNEITFRPGMNISPY